MEKKALKNYEQLPQRLQEWLKTHFYIYQKSNQLAHPQNR